MAFQSQNKSSPKPKNQKDPITNLTKAKQTPITIHVKITPSTSVYKPTDFTQELKKPPNSSKLFQQLTKRCIQLKGTSTLNRMTLDYKHVLEYKAAISNQSGYVSHFDCAYYQDYEQQGESYESGQNEQHIAMSERQDFQKWREQNNFRYKKRILQNPKIFGALL